MDRTEKARADALSALGAEEQQVINRVINWANEQPPIRALLLTGSRANPRARIDRLSDYDIEMAVTDTRPFAPALHKNCPIGPELPAAVACVQVGGPAAYRLLPDICAKPFAPDERWLQWYGTPLVMFRDSNIADGLEAFARLVLYEDGTRIDYNFYPVQLLTKVVAAPELPRDLDLGYHVLVDKDDLTKGLKPPTHTANVPRPPTAAQFQEVVEEFWWDTTYVAKFLWRDELFFAHASLRSARDGLLRLLEWHVEIDHEWSLPLWVRGRRMKRRLTPDRWTDVERTFAGADLQENWNALFALTELFGRSGEDVGARLGYVYPQDLDRRVSAYLSLVRQLKREER